MQTLQHEPLEVEIGSVIVVPVERPAEEDAPSLRDEIEAALRELAFPLAVFFYISLAGWVLWFLSCLVGRLP